MAGWSLFDIGTCGCCGPAGFNLTVKGCGNTGIPALTVNVYDHSGGTLLFSGTINSSGVVTVTGVTITGTTWVEVTGSGGRFNAYGHLVNTLSPAFTITLVVATGYHCCLACSCFDPIADTLNWTGAGGTYAGTGSMFWGNLGNSGWIGVNDPAPTIFYGLSFCGTTEAQTCRVNLNQSGTHELLTIDSFACPPSFQIVCHDSSGTSFTTTE